MHCVYFKWNNKDQQELNLGGIRTEGFWSNIMVLSTGIRIFGGGFVMEKKDIVSPSPKIWIPEVKSQYKHTSQAHTTKKAITTVNGLEKRQWRCKNVDNTENRAQSLYMQGVVFNMKYNADGVGKGRWGVSLYIKLWLPEHSNKRMIEWFGN